ncbi:twin transmembrane helix small protein [Povalibacter sp.]|uniref:twin transmembrane helix small protein n=1 Tax=Povalibacter sp. TaxID=1962978 RepID=UPI002F40A04C
MRIFVVVLLLAIVASMGQALFVMSSGPTTSPRMVRALTLRVALSVALFLFLLLGWHLGWIEPHQVG